VNPFDLYEAKGKSRRGKTLLERAKYAIGADKSRAVPKYTARQVKRLLHAKLAAKRSRR